MSNIRLLLLSVCLFFFVLKIKHYSSSVSLSFIASWAAPRHLPLGKIPTRGNLAVSWELGQHMIRVTRLINNNRPTLFRRSSSFRHFRLPVLSPTILQRRVTFCPIRRKRRTGQNVGNRCFFDLHKRNSSPVVACYNSPTQGGGRIRGLFAREVERRLTNSWSRPRNSPQIKSSLA